MKNSKFYLRFAVITLIIGMMFNMCALFITNKELKNELENAKCREDVRFVVIKVPVKEEVTEENEVIEEIEIKEEPVKPVTEVISNDSNKFTVTYYCGCSICCGQYSSGSELEAYGCKGDKLTPMYSIAADPKVLPYGTIVHDEDGNEYKVQDVGGWIKGNHIDIFVGSHAKALELGRGKKTLTW